MENVIISYFDVESEAFQALADLKKLPKVNGAITLSEVSLMKKENGQVVHKDGFDTGSITGDDKAIGGLIGGLIGLLGGPIGLFVGAGIGAAIGAIQDAIDKKEEESILAEITTKMQEGDVAILAVVKEETESTYDDTMSKYQVTTARYDAEAIRKEVEAAKEAAKAQK